MTQRQIDRAMSEQLRLMRDAIDNGGKTGWPPGLLQDDDKKLSRWFASRLDAREVVRRQFGWPVLKGGAK